MSDTEITDNLTIKYMRKLHRWRMAFFGVVILLAGIVIGGASMLILMPRVIKHPPGPFRGEKMLPMLERRLRLSDEQSEKIKPIMTEYMEKLHDIRMDARTEVGQILEQMQKEISAVLTERQRELWQEQLNRLQRELRPGGRRGNGRGGPPGRGMGEGPRRGRGQRERFRQGRGAFEPGPFDPPPPPPDEPDLSLNDVDGNSTNTNEKSKDGQQQE